jgi:hypothetical protein
MSSMATRTELASGRVVIVGVAEGGTHMPDSSINLEMLTNTVEFSVAGSDEWASYEAAKISA